MGDSESCSSRAVDFAASQSRNQRQKTEVYNDVLSRLRDLNDEEATLPGFEEELWAHFYRLPTRYSLDVNVERAEDVLMHKRLLQAAEDPATRPAIEVRLVQVLLQCMNTRDSVIDSFKNLVGEVTWVYAKLGLESLIPLLSRLILENWYVVLAASNGNSVDPPLHPDSARKVDLPSDSIKLSIHPPPAFGSFPDLEHVYEGQNKDITRMLHSWLMHEITISTNDKPKLLSQLTSLLSEIGLNIQEAHTFSTIDGYSLDVFVVDNWPIEETEQLKNMLAKEIPKIEKSSQLKAHVIYPVMEHQRTRTGPSSYHENIPAELVDVWEIDASLLRYESKIASGSYGDLYKGTFCSQDVAIKVLRSEHLTNKLWKEFIQEVFIMRKVRHKNVVRFIGACTRRPCFCIVTEFMSGGSMHDFLHKRKENYSLQFLLRVAIDVSKGMNYLHQNHIIHRDLKAANLLMDEMEHFCMQVAKIADFGVARVQDQSAVMTAETGTYRWMAPEVIEHKPYDHKADVFSFGIVLWELLTGKLPYENLTPLQAAVGVVQQGLRPSIPKNTHPKFVELLQRCWQQDPSWRPEFSEILELLQQLARMVAGENEGMPKERSPRKVVTAVRQARNSGQKT